MRIELQGKSLHIELTRQAARALAARQTPLTAEMELYFSCLIRKRVRFVERSSENAVAAGEKLRVCFRPVMTAHCGKEHGGDEPPLTDFPISNPAAFVPAWLRIDHRDGRWQGAFGF